MSAGRDIVVLVENLTEEEFRIEESIVDSSEINVLQQPTSFQRSVKLRWHSSSSSSKCRAAVEYVSVSNASGYGSSTSSTAPPPRRRFVVAASLPSSVAPKVGKWASNWVPGMPSAKPCFTAWLSSPATCQGSLTHYLDEAAPLDNGVSEECEWIVLRNCPEVMEVRVRLLPQEPLPFGIPSELEAAEDERNAAEELRADELETRRLRAYHEVISSLNKQATQLDEVSAREPMDLQRLQNLPDKARIDLLLSVLCVLCRHRALALERFKDDGQAEGDELLAPLGAEENLGRGDDSPEADNFVTSGARKFTRLRDGAKKLLGRDNHDDYRSDFDSALSEHAENVFRALVPLCAFEDVATNKKVADLVRCYLPSKDAAEPSAPEVPNPALLCEVVRVAIDGSNKNDDDWSTDQVLQIGSEDACVRFLQSVRVIDAELASSLPVAVQGLNNGRLFCPEDCCLVFSVEDNGYWVLYRRDKKQQTLTLLQVESESELRLAPTAPAEVPAPAMDAPLKTLGMQLNQRVLTRENSSGGASAEDARLRPLSVPRTWLVARDFFAMTIGTGSGSFDARSRAALYDFAAGLGVPPRLAARWENEIGGVLFEMLEASSVVEQFHSQRKKWNRGKVAMAAAGGGVILAVTGGLAAPVLAAGVAGAGGAVASAGAAVGLTHAGLLVGGALAAFGTALAGLGTAGAVVLFGATGAGLTGWKLNKRWGDLEEFQFEPLGRNKIRRTLSIEIPATDAKSVKKLDEAVEAGNGTITESMLVNGAGGAELPVHSGSHLERRECLPASALGSGGAEGPFVCYRFARDVDVQERAVHLAIFVSGWLQDESDFTKPWIEAARTCFPSSGHLGIRWETKGLKRLNEMFKSLVTNQVASTSASFWLRGVAAGAATAGSYAAMAAAWPVTIIAAMSNLDNAWLVCIERARLAGQCLAHVLADRQAVGQRPVTLVGHSMGARLLFYCMLELHRMKEFHVVDDVILLGAPVSTRPGKWRKVRAAASGRVVNGYLRGDWALAFFYRYLEWGLTVAGLSEVKVPGVENVNLKGLGIEGHSDYPNHMSEIFAKMCIGERRLFVV